MTKLLLALCAALPLAGAMPVEQQNAIVQKYCAVCHSDAHPNGKLSLEHFDAAHADPGIAAMMLAKLTTGAMGAAGITVPDAKTKGDFREALTAEAVGADAWVITRGQTLSASIVRTVGEDHYRLQLTCGMPAPQVQLTWSPNVVPESGREMLTVVDNGAQVSQMVHEIEKNGNGKGVSGPGGTLLPTFLPKQSLSIGKLFGDEKVEFPLSDLDPATRIDLAACFSSQK